MDLDGPKPRVHLLVTSPDAAGGIARATANLANGLADRYSVQIIGLRRLGSGRRFPLDPRVRVRYVTDNLGPLGHVTDKIPSPLLGFSRRQGHSAHVDLVLRRMLRSLEPGVVISTRPSLHLAAVRHVPDHCATIGQDHVNLDFRVGNHSLSVIRRAIDRLDRFVVLTEADAADYREAFPEAASRIQVIRNAAPWPVSESDGPREKVVLAAGHLGLRKGFDRLIEAYALVARDHPDWRLHIYGSGPRGDELRQLIRERGMKQFIHLKGRIHAMEQVMEKSAIFALTSRNEGFPMVLVEAMTQGLPIVSYDCPRGPAEIVDDQTTGFLVDDGDEVGLAAALGTLMDDPGLRRRMGAAAREHAVAYQPETILRSWTSLIDTVGSPAAPAR